MKTTLLIAAIALCGCPSDEPVAPDAAVDSQVSVDAAVCSPVNPGQTCCELMPERDQVARCEGGGSFGRPAPASGTCGVLTCQTTCGAIDINWCAP